MRALVLLLAVLLPLPAPAEVLVATRTLRAASLIGPGDVALAAGTPPPGAATRTDQAVGLEARITLYAGRPIPLSALSAPALVERNQTVALLYLSGGLEIRAEGRALGRAGEGEAVRILNLASRSTVSGRVAGPGLVIVGP